MFGQCLWPVSHASWCFFIFTHTHTPCCAGGDEKGTKVDMGKTRQDIKWH
jgi:hypothetical protein